MKVGFCGLGVMGSPMARHLASKGHDVVVYNRNTQKAQQWVEKNGGSFALTPREVGEQCDVVMVCVGNDGDVRSVVFGADGLVVGLKSGSVLVDHTTASATLARELSAACSAKGVGFIDAPVSGGQAGAENGALTVMCGCDDQKVFDRMRPVFDAYAKACQRMGDAGAGQLTKWLIKFASQALSRVLPKHLILRCVPVLTQIRSLKLFQKALRNHGKWKIAQRQWCAINTTLVLQSNGCAKTSAFASMRQKTTAPI